MLDTLDTIDWSKVFGCYGSSEDIPAAIRDLTSDNVEIRNTAISTLYSSLEHQGTVYLASAYATPFLIELLADPQVQGKSELVNLLAQLTYGDSYNRQHMHLSIFAKERETQAFKEEMREQIKWAERTHQAVRKGLPIYLTLLSDQDPRLRMEITYLLASFKEDSVYLISHVKSRFEVETDEHVIACLLLCLGRLLPPTADSSTFLMKYMTNSNTPLVRFATAISFFFLLKEKMPGEAVTVLLNTIADSEPVQDAYFALPSTWAGRAAQVDAIFYVSRLTASNHQTLISERLVEVFPTLDDRIVMEAVDILLRIAFRQGKSEPRMTFDDLKPPQQNVLRALVTNDSAWSWEALLEYGALSRYGLSLDLLNLGLPSKRKELQAFIIASAQQETK